MPPSGAGCRDCESNGGWWLHLRRCAVCANIGCCDDSLAKHATAHALATGHSFIQSFEPGEDWFWNYQSQEFFEGPTLAAPAHHPLDQTVPGPAERVPHDWMAILQSQDSAR
ncbi:MAG TPA: UBP-type zinc finger domain-containing protein [Microbacteriaceae bacterium]